MAVKKGYKQTEVGVIPEDWRVEFLGSCVLIKGGGAFRSQDATKIGIRWLKIANVGINEIIWSDESFLPKSYQQEFDAFLLNQFDYVVALTRPILGNRLKIARIRSGDAPALLNQRVGKLFKVGNNHLEFISFLLQKPSVISSLQQSMAGTDPPNLSTRHISGIQVAVPPTLAEQEAIAGALSDADAWIESLEQLIAKKRQIKQGAMQELLTGKRRLPGFNGEWETKRLGDLGRCQRGVSYNPSIDLFSGDTNSSVRLLRSNNVQDAKIVFSDIQFVASSRVSSEQYLHKNDILICMANGSRDLVGKAGRYCEKKESAYTFGAFMGAFRPAGEIANPVFCFYLFQTAAYRQHIAILLAGSSINNLTPDNLESHLVVVPKTLAEQTAIATVLSDMDTEIESLESKLAKAREIKQGMMQELLTGRIRLIEN